MPQVIIIAAVAENNVIGKDNKLLWHLSEDLKRFKRLTSGYPVIMGRKTYESLPFKPLPKRRNIIVTRNAKYTADGCEIVSSPEAAIDICSKEEKVFVIGGEAIYKAFLKHADTLELTKVYTNIKGDAFFPDFNEESFSEEKSNIAQPDEKNDYPYSFHTYTNLNKMEEVTIKKLSDREIEDKNIKSWPIWEKEVSVFDWHYDDIEDCLILEGEVTVTTNNNNYHIKAGDFVTFKKGLSCNWNITKAIKKHYNFR